MAHVAIDDSEGMYESDPFRNVDCQTAMALLEGKLQQRLGEAARTESAGFTGRMRVLLQRIAPGRFGSEITPSRVEQLYRFVEETSSAGITLKFPDDSDAYDRAVAHYRDVTAVVNRWPVADLRRYLSEVDQHVRRRGSIDDVLADVRADAQRAVGESLGEPLRDAADMPSDEMNP